MYITGFVHRDDLFKIMERWMSGKPDPADALRLTDIFICDGFVLGETLAAMSGELLGYLDGGPILPKRIQFKGELRDAICGCSTGLTPRARELFRLYQGNPDFYYREVPINGFMCLNEGGELLGVYRVKRPRRIAEKANRKIANWIFGIVQDEAQRMAQTRALKYGVPLDWLITPESEMVREFVEAEITIAQRFSQGSIKLDRTAMTIHDVGGAKVIAGKAKLEQIKASLRANPRVRVVEEQGFKGSYRAESLIVEVGWDPEQMCRRYAESGIWTKYLNRGIPEKRLKKGLDQFFHNPKPSMEVEIILATFPDMVESELGESIHEGRIISQRGDRTYMGHLPTNVEFLVEYLFAVGFSPVASIESLPIKLWGRYLPDALISHIRRLYRLPQFDLLY